MMLANDASTVAALSLQSDGIRTIPLNIIKQLFEIMIAALFSHLPNIVSMLRRQVRQCPLSTRETTSPIEFLVLLKSFHRPRL